MVETFSALWTTLALEGAKVAFDETITAEGYARLTSAAAATRPGAPFFLPSSALPHLSIDLRDPASRAVGDDPTEGDIVITGVLGEGGMGRVLLARQRSLEREVAVKTLRDGPRSASDFDALVAEGLITGFLEHPNITPVHQLGTDGDDRPLLVMKRIAGVAWQDLIDAPDHAAWETLTTLPRNRLHAHLEILMQVCNGISFAHSRSIIHRDIKPENVMIGEFGEVYVCDWGIGLELARPETRRRGLVGTPSYLAPEMLDPEGELGPATDVYLLGGTLHTVLTGRPRHDGESIKEVIEAAFESKPFAYDRAVPAELAALCNQATAREPAARPRSAMAFRRALSAYLSHESSIALAGAAADRLAEAVSGRTATAVDHATIARALTESRFGFTQALREWPDNEAAREGLGRCLETAIEIEVDAGNVAGARALLSEMASPGGALRKRVDELARRVEARAVEVEKLEAMRREADLSISAGQRRGLLLALTAAGVVMAVVLRVLIPGETGDQPQTLTMALPTTTILTLASLGVFFARKTLFVTSGNRQFVGVVLGGMSLELLHRIECWVMHSTLRDAMRGDLLILCGALGAAGFFVSRTWFLAALGLVAASIVGVIAPAYTLTAYVVSHLAVLVILALGWRPGARRG